MPISKNTLIPIEPAVDAKTGRLVSLLPFLGDTDAALPVALAAEDMMKLRGTQNNFFQTSVKTATKLGVMGALSTTADYLYDAAVFEVLAGINKVRTGDTTGFSVLETFWGASIRIVMRVRAFDAQATGGFGILAASVEMRAAQVEYQVRTVGAVTPEMLAIALGGMPLFGTLSFESYVSFNQAATRLAVMLKDNMDLPLRPVAVALRYETPGSSQSEALATRYAMLQIVQGKTLNDAVKNVPGTVDVETVKNTYMQVLAGAAAPGHAHAEKARRWLDA